MLLFDVSGISYTLLQIKTPYMERNMAKRNKKTKTVTPESELASLQSQYQSCPRAHFMKRFAAYIYDVFALAAVLMLATAIALLAVYIGEKANVINLAMYRDYADYLSKNAIFIAYLAFVIAGFFSHFWVRGGQTIGMKAWRLRVQNSDGSNITTMQSIIRLGTSAFGLGNLLALLQNRNAFQDLWAECEVVVLTKELNNWKGFKGMGFMDEKK